MALRVFTFLGLIFALGACSIQKDVPDFVYPASSVDPKGAFPSLLPVDRLQSNGTPRINDDTQSLDNLSARVESLRSRTNIAPIGGISASRIAQLRKRAAILQKASF